MGWFGMPGYSEKTAFETLFSQSQYKKKFELLWQKHIGRKSIAVYSLDDAVYGETILWENSYGELMYKPISWIDSMEYIPKKWVEKLLVNASEFELECYNTFEKKKK